MGQDTQKSWVEEFYPELAPREPLELPPPEPAPKSKDTTEEPSVVQEPAPSPGPALEEPALQLGEGGVWVTPDRQDFQEMERMDHRVKKAKVGRGVSAGVLAVGFVMGLAAAGGGVCYGTDDPSSCPDPWVAPVGATGAVLFVGGLAGMIASGVMLRKRKRDRDNLWEAHRRRQFRVEVDTSDDAFTVIVTRKYDGDELTGATVFIRHRESGQHSNLYIDATEIDSLEQVIREHKAKLLTAE